MEQPTVTTSLTGHFVQHIRTAQWTEISAWIFVLLWFITFLTSPESPKVKGAPVVGKKFWWEPTVLSRLRFTTKSRQVLQDAYDKVADNLASRLDPASSSDAM